MGLWVQTPEKVMNPKIYHCYWKKRRQTEFIVGFMPESG
jgi:hypothetical protein